MYPNTQKDPEPDPIAKQLKCQNVKNSPSLTRIDHRRHNYNNNCLHRLNLRVLLSVFSRHHMRSLRGLTFLSHLDSKFIAEVRIATPRHMYQVLAEWIQVPKKPQERLKTRDTRRPIIRSRRRRAVSAAHLKSFEILREAISTKRSQSYSPLDTKGVQLHKVPLEGYSRLKRSVVMCAIRMPIETR